STLFRSRSGRRAPARANGCVDGRCGSGRSRRSARLRLGARRLSTAAARQPGRPACAVAGEVARTARSGPRSGDRGGPEHESRADAAGGPGAQRAVSSRPGPLRRCRPARHADLLRDTAQCPAARRRTLRRRRRAARSAAPILVQLHDPVQPDWPPRRVGPLRRRGRRNAGRPAARRPLAQRADADRPCAGTGTGHRLARPMAASRGRAIESEGPDAMIIDYASRPPAPEFDQSKATHLANYRRVYAASESKVADAAGAGTMSDYLAMYDRAGARHVVVKARDVESTFGWRIRNEDVAAFCRAHGERFIGFAGVDPHKGMTAVRELEFAVRELGLKGLNLQCFEHKLAIDDPRMYPLYAKCIELDIPVNIHCSINFSSVSLMEYGRPLLLD